ncbi:uracil-DNA glycosylase [Clostridiaceae bacterium HSG29]|nr:uracil-DNA glycosylase [Clostridiaceae bacterium HSG29]
MKINIENDWKEILENEFKKKYFNELSLFIDNERLKHEIYPSENDVFEAFNLCSYKNTKIVLIGQDPYHGENQAHGLCFSVKPGCKIPPSLRNIYKELNNDIGCNIPQNGYLTNWAKQGMLMINAVFTVQKGHANSHSKKGWEDFTTEVIKHINNKESPVVFILWGNFAQNFEKYITNKNHLIIKSYHPSPLSASRGFFDSKPFSKCNNFLKNNNLKEINWCEL